MAFSLHVQSNKNLILNLLKEICKNLDIIPENMTTLLFWVILIRANRISTCFKNLLKASCIDLLMTSRPKSFQDSMAVEIGLSDFHKMTLTVMKVFYKKNKKQTLSRIGIINTFLMKRLCLTLKTVLFK